MTKPDFVEIYRNIKYGHVKFNEEVHCPLILEIMSQRNRGTFSAFCVAVNIGEKKFYDWLRNSEVFQLCYCLGKMYARENWEAEGRELRDETLMPGTSSYRFEYWRMIGWSKFGIGKNSRIRLDLNPESKPNEHYAQLIKQAADGEFTAGEIKQLMEAINVGLNTHQVFALQKEINQLREDLVTMSENSNGNNTFADKRTTQEN